MTVITGDCLAAMRSMPDDSVDAIVTDPPAGIAFMGTAWDGDKGGRRQWISWLAEVMSEALRVVKPGGHALVWALPRTSHWTGTALEDAGWEVRDVLTHIFGSGFPKSANVSKAIDATAGMREAQPSTPDAIKWDGWHSALKPAQELWYLARKPLDGTIAANAMRHGTGALNIAANRVGTSGGTQAVNFGADAGTMYGGGKGKPTNEIATIDAGRWPPNLLLTHSIECNATGRCVPWCPVAEMDRQSGASRSFIDDCPRGRREGSFVDTGADKGSSRPNGTQHNDSGGASRFFPRFRYQAKPSTEEKSAGLTARSSHPTVKSIALMRWLVRLITPPDGVVLDPFAGSGTTGIACVHEGASFIGIEQSEEFAAIARARIEHHSKQGRLF